MTCPECHHRPSGRFDANGMQCHCKCHDIADDAPKMLEACEQALQRIESDIESDKHKTAEGHLLRAVIAVAKVKGHPI